MILCATPAKMSGKKLVVLIIFLAALPTQLVARPPFVSVKAPSETITNYEVVTPVITYRSGTESHPRQLWVHIASDSASYTLQLELNEALLAQHFTSSYFDQDGHQVIDESPVVNCFYQGKVSEFPEWIAAISTCHGLQGSFGKLGDKSQYYHLEPLNSTDTSATQLHALYLASEFTHRNRDCGSTGHNHEAAPLTKDVDRLISENRLRRQVNGFLVVEWMIVNDNRQYNAFGQNLTATVLRSLEVTNNVDMLYRVLNIRVVLVHVMTWTNGDLISVVSNPDVLLQSFREYRSTEITTPHDSTMLLTGIDIDGSTIGIAYVGTMCSENSAVGLTQDGFGEDISYTASTAAHELGHIFNMDHDDPSCTCPEQNGAGCIMSAISGFPASTQWTDCSVSYLNTGFQESNLDRCLLNEPTTTIGDPVCGNGIREGDELCDCGTPEECSDPCCNATTCQLSDGSQCFSSPCCLDCQFRQYGYVCREAPNECDIAEYCTGDDSECPVDTYLQDGNICNNDQSFCFSGSCVTYDEQCRYSWGPDSGMTAEECFDRNTGADRFGNCGYDTTDYIACPEDDVMCGQLHCAPGDFINNAGVYTLWQFRSADLPDGSTAECYSFTTPPGTDYISPGLVQDGSRCGPERLCFDQTCRAISDLGYIQSCPTGTNGLVCSGNGNCNNLNACSCIVDFDGDICEEYLGTDINECNSNNGGCAQSCSNTVGSFICSCDSGYILDGDGRNCNDVDECLSNNGGCSQTCTNTMGSFECTCGSGFMLQNGLDCADIHECAEGTDDCTQLCTNTIGSFTCDCLPGFMLGGDALTCTEINECNSNNGGCEHVCTNTEGSFTCSCDTGYLLGADGRTCEDNDECNVNNGNCEQTCSNSIGGFQCDCYSDFKLETDGTTCTAKTQCESDSNCEVFCSADSGVDECSCPMGFQLGVDDKSCLDLDECALGTDECDFSCTNTQGLYTCGTQDGFSLAGDHRTSEDINECNYDSDNCDHYCINTAGSFECTCANGYVLDDDGKTCFVNGTTAASGTDDDGESSGGADGGAIAGAVIGVLLALAIIAAVTVGVVYLVWRTKFRASYPPPRVSTVEPAWKKTPPNETHIQQFGHQSNGSGAGIRPSAPPPKFAPMTTAPIRPPAYTPTSTKPTVVPHSGNAPKRPPPPRPSAPRTPPSRPPPIKPAGARETAANARPPPPSRKPPTPSQTKPSAPRRPIPAPKPTKLHGQWPPPNQNA